MEVQSDVEVERPESVVDGKSVVAIIIVVDNQRKAAEIFGVVPHQSYSPCHVEVEIVEVEDGAPKRFVCLSFFHGLQIAAGPFVADGRSQGHAQQPVAFEHPVVGVSATDAIVVILQVVDSEVLAQLMSRILRETVRERVIVEVQFMSGIGEPHLP